ncbi:MAG TPA: 16S rRNA (guanine(966)-N(2))-methyltransferase RsmD [bacterium]|nr:16S rRNA (guanine(966)-N(2))-methyltransferase RsmD [bacterium]HDP99800.1 16S rRNA (guanine(966)-N(2))-methyltransferase RsmD [bacterium]
MRVIAGKCRGRILFSPKDRTIRPTSDRVKEFIFSYIGNRVENVHILDLFAGAGGLAIEALSRGAHSAQLVDNSAQAIRLIKKNLELTRFLARCRIVHSDVIKYLKFAAKRGSKFGLIFADPPYSDTIYRQLIEFFDKNDLLESGGLFVFEHDSRQNIDFKLKTLGIEATKTLGDTAVTFFHKNEEQV